jgi:hypothetical protein
MRRPWAALAGLATLGLASASGGPKPDPPDVLAAILGAHPEWFASAVANADEHRLQILYTQIDRDAGNRPAFRSFPDRLADAYFYPAGTVKLPAAILALEKLNDLGVPGLTRDTALRIEAGTPAQTAVERDPSKGDGRPTIAHYIKKVFLVSDNDAFNRLYEFLGQEEINEKLWRHGFADARILRRLEAGMDPEENRVTNPFVFFEGDRVVYRQPLARNPGGWTVDGPEVRQGRGFIRDGKLVEEPLDFSHSNYLSVRTLREVLTDGDLRFLYTYMSMLPRESVEPAYPDREEYEYDEIGLPFLARLGRAVYEHERRRERPRRPDLSRFRVHP